MILCWCWLSAATGLAADQGIASWYGEDHRGKAMANGQPFDPDKLTCASWHHPLGTRLKVVHGDRSVLVTVTDRGPNKRLKGRIIDLSRAAFKRLAPLEKGLIRVTVSRQPAGPARVPAKAKSSPQRKEQKR
jgi:rare lipoprotein A